MLISILLIVAPVAFAQNQGIILGHVTEGITGKPIPGVTISLRDRQGLKPYLPQPPSDVSDETGFFELRYVRVGGQYMIDAVHVYDFNPGRVRHTLTATRVEIHSDSTVVNFQFSRDDAQGHLNGERSAMLKERTEEMKLIKRRLSQKKSQEDLEKLRLLEESFLMTKFRITGKDGQPLAKFSNFEIIEELK